MTTYFFRSFFLVVTFVVSTNDNIKAQEAPVTLQELNEKIISQESEIQNLRNNINNETSKMRADAAGYAPLAMVLFLFGGFCALWAQNTGRNSLPWFFLGIIFSVLTVLSILIINSREN